LNAWRSVRVRGVLQLQNGQRQPVDERDDVQAALFASLDHDELAGGEKVVVLGRVKIDEPRLAGSVAVPRVLHLDIDAVAQQPHETPVLFEQVLALDIENRAHDLVLAFGAEIGIEPRYRVFQAGEKHDIAIVAARRSRPIRGEVGTFERAPAQCLEPGQSGEFHRLLAEAQVGQGAWLLVVHDGDLSRSLVQVAPGPPLGIGLNNKQLILLRFLTRRSF
jgi:hypothetical protein